MDYVDEALSLLIEAINEAFDEGNNDTTELDEAYKLLSKYIERREQVYEPDWDLIRKEQILNDKM